MGFEMKTFDSNTYVPRLDPQGKPQSDPQGKPIKDLVCVGTAEVPVFTLDEAGLRDAVKYYTDTVPKGGTPFIVETFNTQNITNARNDLRAAATKGPSQEALNTEAMARITRGGPGQPLFDELVACGGDGSKVQALISRVMEEIKGEYDARRATAFKPAKEGATESTGA